jgi:ABC-type phosphate/phosphonate transport system permease subunit
VLRPAYGNTSLVFLVAALACLAVADITISALDPWAEMARLVHGLLRPDLLSIEVRSVVWTIAFAVLGVGLSAVCGFALAIPYPVLAPVRALATVLRSVHELFWALLLMQVFGLGPTTGLLAIALPYIGFFAKVYAEIIEEADLAAVEGLPRGTALLPAFLYARLPDLLPAFRNYTLYRLECGLRSTLVLGFVGLPTIGFHLESYFKQGHYAQAAALLGCFYVLVGTRRLWARPATLAFLVLGSLLVLPEAVGGGSALANLARFGHDVVPIPLRGHDLADVATWAALLSWLWRILTSKPCLAWQRPSSCRRSHWSPRRCSRWQLSLWCRAVSTGASGRYSDGFGSSWCALHPNTGWPMCDCSSWPFHAAGHPRAEPAQRGHRRLLDGPPRRRTGLPAGRAAGRQPLRVWDGAAPLRAVPGLYALPLGDHSAGVRDLRHSRRDDARLSRGCGDLRAAL